MGLKTVILDDHDGRELPDGTEPTEVQIDGAGKLYYLSPENQRRLEQLLEGFFTIAFEQPGDFDAIDQGHAERVADERFQTHGFSAADVRAFCKRNGIEVGDRGLVSQEAYDALKASEDEGCESAADVLERLMAKPSVPEADRNGLNRVKRQGERAGHSGDRERKVSTEDYESIDAMALRIIRNMPVDGQFKVVAERQPNDRIVTAVNKGISRFSYCKGGAFEALSKQSEPFKMGVYDRPEVDIYVRRIK